jgi:uncharacterized protein with NRDE domain
MCLIVAALAQSARYPLVVAANRDEQHARPTQAAAWWLEPPRVLGGRDLRAGGTWLAVDGRGRLAAVTNVRDPPPEPASRSRGTLVAEYLGGADAALVYAARAARDGARFGAFNLLLFDGAALHYASNRAPTARFAAGVHAFSNAPHDVEWPKIASARAGVARVLEEQDALIEPLFELLAHRGAAGPPEERYRAAHFIVGPIYGTRCSTVVLRDDAGNVTFVERSFDPDGQQTGEVRETFTVQRG